MVIIYRFKSDLRSCVSEEEQMKEEVREESLEGSPSWFVCICCRGELKRRKEGERRSNVGRFLWDLSVGIFLEIVHWTGHR